MGERIKVLGSTEWNIKRMNGRIFDRLGLGPMRKICTPNERSKR